MGKPKIEKKIIKKIWQEPKISAKDIWTQNNFFADFEKHSVTPKKSRPPLVPKKIWIRQRDKIKHEKKLTPNQIKKNIGRIFQP